MRRCTKARVLGGSHWCGAVVKGGQWRRALGAYEQMRLQRCKPDAIVYNAIIDTLWETGVIWAQRKVRPHDSPCVPPKS